MLFLFQVQGQLVAQLRSSVVPLDHGFHPICIHHDAVVLYHVVLRLLDVLQVHASGAVVEEDGAETAGDGIHGGGT